MQLSAKHVSTLRPHTLALRIRRSCLVALICLESGVICSPGSRHRLCEHCILVHSSDVWGAAVATVDQHDPFDLGASDSDPIDQLASCGCCRGVVLEQYYHILIESKCNALSGNMCVCVFRTEKMSYSRRARFTAGERSTCYFRMSQG